MSTPTGGSWNKDEQGDKPRSGQSGPQQGQSGPGSTPAYGQGGQGAPQGQSLGQGYGQQTGGQPPSSGAPTQAQQAQPGQGQPGQPYGRPPQGQPGQGQPGQGQPPQGQPGYGGQQAGPGQHGGGFGQQAQQVGHDFVGGASTIAAGAGDGVGALFSDLQFRKSLTERIAGLTFLGVIIWAVLNFISSLTYNFGSQDFGGQSVKNMSTGAGIMHTLADLVWLVIIVAIVRLLLEVAINIARIAQRDKKA